MTVLSRSALLVRLGIAAIVLATPRLALAVPTEVGGGGGKATDCLATFVAEVNVPLAKPRHVICTDGDPTCDADMAVNGVCAIELSVCGNSTFSPSCSLNGVDTITVRNAIDDGFDPKFDPNFQALQNRIDTQIDAIDEAGMQMSNQCTTATTIGVPIKGPFGSRCRPGVKSVRLTAFSKPISGRVYKDTDVIRLRCLPSPSNGCNAETLFGGTFDRVQRQILSQSCALSTCHDSQSVAGGLLLEVGASYGNLVNATTFTPAAFLAGWKRVDAPDVGVSGHTETSFLYRKVAGTLPNADFGARMPLKRPKLHPSLVEVIRLWILAGAPETGWVTGTN